MRQSVSAIALIGRVQNRIPQWLAQWNEGWRHYHFVGGHTNPEESFRECLIRELGEELGLRENADFTVSPAPRAHLEYTAWSLGSQEETQYTMELFDVQLAGHNAQINVEQNPHNRWLTEDEIRAHRTADGQPISETMALLMEKAGTVRPC